MVDTWHEAQGHRLSAAQLHDILRLRTAIFVVEQDCAYQEVDGLDLRPDTIHLWVTDDVGIASYARLLTEPSGHRIGRVMTRRDRRRTGISRMLMARAMTRTTGTPTMLYAQTYLIAYYESLGFQVDGAEFVEDGISHVPMRYP